MLEFVLIRLLYLHRCGVMYAALLQIIVFSCPTSQIVLYQKFRLTFDFDDRSIGVGVIVSCNNGCVRRLCNIPPRLISVTSLGFSGTFRFVFDWTPSCGLV